MDKIPEQDYQRALGQFRLQLNGTMNCFRVYGMEKDVDEAIVEIVTLTEQFAMRCRGKDKPIKVRETPRRKPTE